MATIADEEAVLQGRDLQAIFQLWERKHTVAGFDPEPYLTRYAIRQFHMINNKLNSIN